jgi:hypothetical protein
MALEITLQTTEANVEELVASLQIKMRVYDRLQSEISSMRFDVMASDAVLEDVDIEQMLLEGNALVGMAALNKLVIDRKMAELQRREAELQYSAGGLIVLQNKGKQFQVRALDPKKEKIAKFWIGDTSSFSGKFSEEQAGNLYEIGLRSSDGGFVKLANKRQSVMYQAAPLFDRKDDYKPLFDIKYLN